MLRRVVQRARHPVVRHIFRHFALHLTLNHRCNSGWRHGSHGRDRCCYGCRDCGHCYRHVLSTFFDEQYLGVSAAIPEALSLDFRILGRATCLTSGRNQFNRYAFAHQISLHRLGAFGGEHDVVAIPTGRAGVAHDVDLEFNIGTLRCDATNQRVQLLERSRFEFGRTEVEIRLLRIAGVRSNDSLLDPRGRFCWLRRRGGRSDRRHWGSDNRRAPVRIRHALGRADHACDLVAAEAALRSAQFVAQHDHAALIIATAFKIATSAKQFTRDRNRKWRIREEFFGGKRTCPLATGKFPPFVIKTCGQSNQHWLVKLAKACADTVVVGSREYFVGDRRGDILLIGATSVDTPLRGRGRDARHRSQARARKPFAQVGVPEPLFIFLTTTDGRFSQVFVALIECSEYFVNS